MTTLQQKRINQLMPLIRAIKEKCLDCCAGNTHEVKLCACDGCALFPYREGLNKKNEKSKPEKSEKDESRVIRESGE